MLNNSSRFRLLSLIVFFVFLLTSFSFFHHLVHYSQPSSFDFYTFSKRLDHLKLNQEQRNRVLKFQQLLHSEIQQNISQPTIQWLNFINHQTNHLFEYRSDQHSWNQIDYWASPSELLIKGQGDCEDYAIFKYFFFRSMGLDFAFSDSLRLAYVQYFDSNTMTVRPHMVLFIYDNLDNTDPWVMDNLTSEVHRLSKRTDLHFVFSFNHEHFFQHISAPPSNPSSPLARIKRWADVIEKSHNEGFH